MTERQPPMREAPLMDSQEPKLAISTTDRVFARRTLPPTDRESPNRAKLRRDKEEATSAQLKSESEEPKRTLLLTESDEPMFANSTTEKRLRNSMIPLTETPPPKRAILRIDKPEPNCA